MGRNPSNYKRSWKTIKIIQIDGVPFAVQQRQSVLVMSSSNGKAMETTMDDRHRMKPLLDIIDNRDEVISMVSDAEDLSDLTP